MKRSRHRREHSTSKNSEVLEELENSIQNSKEFNLGNWTNFVICVLVKWAFGGLFFFESFFFEFSLKFSKYGVIVPRYTIVLFPKKVLIKLLFWFLISKTYISYSNK